MMQCNMRQHFADRYWLHEHRRGHASWREPYDEEIYKRIDFVRGLVCRWNIQKMRPESSEYVRKTNAFFFTHGWRINIALEGTLKSMRWKFWERNCMKPEMQTALLNTYPPKLTATILKALREQLTTS